MPIRLLLFIFFTHFVHASSDSNLGKIAEMIASHYPDTGAGAVVLIRKGDDVLLKKGFGLINIEHQVPANPQNKFHIASITKQFSAVLTLMLVENGKLNLDENISKYLPNYPAAQETKITLRQLLGHTAGIPAFEGEETGMYDHHGTEYANIDEILSFILDKPLDFQPGSQFRYSNGGYVLVQKILEIVSEKSFSELLQENIFEPLNMKNTCLYSFYNIVPGLSKGYEVSEDDGKTIHAKAVRPGMEAAGSIITTIDDLVLWYDALAQNKLISEVSKLQAFTSQKLNEGRETKYGLGWRTTHVGQFTSIEHGGNNHGTEAYAMFFPEVDVQIIILSNLNRSYPEKLALKLAVELLNLEEISSPPVSMVSLKKFSGVFQHSDGSTRKIILKEGQLFSQRPGGLPYPLVNLGGNRFQFEGFIGDEIMFLQNRSGEFNQLKLDFRTQPAEMAYRQSQ